MKYYRKLDKEKSKNVNKETPLAVFSLEKFYDLRNK